MPTTRRPATIGTWAIRRPSNRRAAWAASASAGRLITSRVITSETSLPGSTGGLATGARWARGSGATSRATMSASETIPTRLPSSTTGSAPMACSTSSPAACLSSMSGGTVMTGPVITSLARTAAHSQSSRTAVPSRSRMETIPSTAPPEPTTGRCRHSSSNMVAATSRTVASAVTAAGAAVM
jgi:hypothetical protein